MWIRHFAHLTKYITKYSPHNVSEQFIFYKESFMGHFTLSYEQLEHQSRVFCLWQRYLALNLHNENHTVQWNRPHLQLYCTALTQRLIPDAYLFIVCQTLLGFVHLLINAVMSTYLLFVIERGTCNSKVMGSIPRDHMY